MPSQTSESVPCAPACHAKRTRRAVADRLSRWPEQDRKTIRTRPSNEEAFPAPAHRGRVPCVDGSKFVMGPNFGAGVFVENYLMRCGAERAKRHGLSDAPRLEGGKHVSRLRTPRSRRQITEVVQIDSRLPYRPDFRPRILLTEGSSSVDDLCAATAARVSDQLLQIDHRLGR